MTPPDSSARSTCLALATSTRSRPASSGARALDLALTPLSLLPSHALILLLTPRMHPHTPCPARRYPTFTAVQLRYDFLVESSAGSYSPPNNGLVPVTMTRTCVVLAASVAVPHMPSRALSSPPMPSLIPSSTLSFSHLPSTLFPCPLLCPRSYFSFFDLDTGEPQFDGSSTQVRTPP